MDVSSSVLSEVKRDIVRRIDAAISKAKNKGEFPSDLDVTVKRDPVSSRPGRFRYQVAMAIGRAIKSDGRSAAGAIVKYLGSMTRQSVRST